MNEALRKIAFFIGLGILGVSIFWSQDGFNFSIAGDSGYGQLAKAIAWFLAIVVSVLQFVFSSNIRELNKSLLLLGFLAYAYSIYTNYQGIVHFQGGAPNVAWAWVLAFFLDATAEPLIAWGLYASREGDFLGNIVKAVMSAPERVQQENRSKQEQSRSFAKNNEKIEEKPSFSTLMRHGSQKSGKKHVSFENLHGIKGKNERPRTYFDE